jgi:hypothetical protein
VSDTQKQQLLVNLRPHVVEVHLPERVITVGPLASVSITDTGPQVDELVRRGLLALQDVDADDEAADDQVAGDQAAGDQAAEPAGPDGEAGSDSEDEQDGEAAGPPPTKRTSRARGSAAKRGGN